MKHVKKLHVNARIQFSFHKADCDHDVKLEPEIDVTVVDEDAKPEDRVETALKCLQLYDPASRWNSDLIASFRYWKIRDYAHAYRSKLASPSMVGYLHILGFSFFTDKLKRKNHTFTCR